MGICCSSQIKAETSSPFGFFSSSKTISGDGPELSNSSRKSSSGSVHLTSRSEDEILQQCTLKSFGFNQLKAASRNFRLDSVIGEGGFGSVFKGWIDETSFVACKPGTGMAVAVKRLNQDGRQGHKEWLAEINYLGQLRHPNLVRLIGYCSEDDQRLLVYEFMPKGSLENHLFRSGTYFQPLSWKLRMKIALGAARGLAYLHNSEVKVIYRDFKTSNILLDGNYNAKLSDFGLARDGPIGDESHVSTRVMGTHGYAAPEYLSTGHLTAKSDVYSFGVVLLEILSGKKVLDKNRPRVEHNLVKWAAPYLNNKRRIFRVLDARLEGQYLLGQALDVANLALECLNGDPRLRPDMVKVVHTLENQLGASKEDVSNREDREVYGLNGLSQTGRARAKSCRSTADDEKQRRLAYPRPSISALV